MSEVTQRNKKEMEDIAKEMGLEAMDPGPFEVQLDLDKGCVFGKRVHQVLKENGILLTKPLVTRSKNGNKHLYLKSNLPLRHWQRITMQAALGSDAVREVLSLRRLMEGSDCPTALFETAEAAKKVKAWRLREGLAADLKVDRGEDGKEPWADDVPY